MLSNRVQTQRLFLGKTLCGLTVAFLKRVCSRSEKKSATALFFFNSVEALGLVDRGFLSVRWPLRQLHAAVEVEDLHPFVVSVNTTVKNLRATFSFLAHTEPSSADLVPPWPPFDTMRSAQNNSLCVNLWYFL